MDKSVTGVFFIDSFGLLLVPLQSYMVLRWRARAPSDSHSFFVTQMRLKLPNEAEKFVQIWVENLNLPRIEPPIQVEYKRSCGAEIRIFVSFGEGLRSSHSNRSPNPMKSSVTFGILL